MPAYKFQSPVTGMTYDVDFDREPNEAEIEEARMDLEKRERDTGQGMFDASFNEAARGVLSVPKGIVGGLGAAGSMIPGLENNMLQRAGKGIQEAYEEGLPVNPVQAESFPVKAAGAAGQGLGFLGTTIATGGLGVAPAVVARLGLGAAGLMGAEQGAELAEQYGVTDPWTRRAFIAGGGAIEAGTEAFGGFGTKDFTKQLLGKLKSATLPAGAIRRAAGTTLTEGGEEIAAGTLQDQLTKGLIEEDPNNPGFSTNGQPLPPDFFTKENLKQRLEEGALGAVGGAVFAGAQAIGGRTSVQEAIALRSEARQHLAELEAKGIAPEQQAEVDQLKAEDANVTAWLEGKGLAPDAQEKAIARYSEIREAQAAEKVTKPGDPLDFSSLQYQPGTAPAAPEAAPPQPLPATPTQGIDQQLARVKAEREQMRTEIQPGPIRDRYEQDYDTQIGDLERTKAELEVAAEPETPLETVTAEAIADPALPPEAATAVADSAAINDQARVEASITAAQEAQAAMDKEVEELAKAAQTAPELQPQIEAETAESNVQPTTTQPSGPSPTPEVAAQTGAQATTGTGIQQAPVQPSVEAGAPTEEVTRLAAKYQPLLAGDVRKRLRDEGVNEQDIAEATKGGTVNAPLAAQHTLKARAARKETAKRPEQPKPRITVTDETWTLEDDLGGTASGRLKDGEADIVDMHSVPFDKRYSEEAPALKRRGFLKNLIDALKSKGAKTIHVRMQSTDTRAALKRLVQTGRLLRPRDEAGLSDDPYFTTFDIPGTQEAKPKPKARIARFKDKLKSVFQSKEYKNNPAVTGDLISQTRENVSRSVQAPKLVVRREKGRIAGVELAPKFRGGEWDWYLPLLEDAELRKLMHETILDEDGIEPDIAAKGFEMRADEYGEALVEAARQRIKLAQDLSEGRTEAGDMATKEKQTVAFEKATESGPVPVSYGTVEVGTVLDVDGTDVTVAEIDHKTGTITLQDGTRFGEQVLPYGETIYVEEVEGEAQPLQSKAEGLQRNEKIKIGPAAQSIFKQRIQTVADDVSLIRAGYDGIGRLMENAISSGGVNEAIAFREWLLRQKELPDSSREALLNFSLPETIQSKADQSKAQSDKERQNRAVLAKAGLPSEPGTYSAAPAVKQAMAKVAASTTLPKFVRDVAKMLANRSFVGVELEIISDPDQKSAGQYFPKTKNSPAKIQINLAQTGLGRVNALGTLIHEALHHVTTGAINRPQTAEEQEAAKWFESTLAKSKKWLEQNNPELAKRFSYELGSMDEFLTAIFTNGKFVNEALSIIPEDYGTTTPKTGFRSVLESIYNKIAELFTGRPVQKGSALEDAVKRAMQVVEASRTGESDVTLQSKAEDETGTQPKETADSSRSGRATEGVRVDAVRGRVERTAEAQGASVQWHQDGIRPDTEVITGGDGKIRLWADESWAEAMAEMSAEDRQGELDKARVAIAIESAFSADRSDKTPGEARKATANRIYSRLRASYDESAETKEIFRAAFEIASGAPFENVTGQRANRLGDITYWNKSGGAAATRFINHLLRLAVEQKAIGTISEVSEGMFEGQPAWEKSTLEQLGKFVKNAEAGAYGKDLQKLMRYAVENLGKSEGIEEEKLPAKDISENTRRVFEAHEKEADEYAERAKAELSEIERTRSLPTSEGGSTFDADARLESLQDRTRLARDYALDTVDKYVRNARLKPHQYDDTALVEKWDAIASDVGIDSAQPLQSKAEEELAPPDGFGWREQFVATHGDYRIAVNNVDGAVRASAWKDGERVGVLRTFSPTNNKKAAPDGWLGVQDVRIDKDHRSKGLATELYRALASHLGEDVKGLYSDKSARANDTEIPKIYKSLGGRTDANGNGFLPKIDAARPARANQGTEPERYITLKAPQPLQSKAEEDEADAPYMAALQGDSGNDPLTERVSDFAKSTAKRYRNRAEYIRNQTKAEYKKANLPLSIGRENGALISGSIPSQLKDIKKGGPNSASHVYVLEAELELIRAHEEKGYEASPMGRAILDEAERVIVERKEAATDPLTSTTDQDAWAKRNPKSAAVLRQRVDQVMEDAGFKNRVKHATHNQFNIFDKTKGVGSNDAFEMDNWGIWTTDYTDDARIYGPNVMVLYGKMQKPRVVQDFDEWFQDYVRIAYPMFVSQSEPLPADELRTYLKEHARKYYKLPPLSGAGAKEYKKMLSDQPGASAYEEDLRKNGQDGVLMEGGFLDGILQTTRVFLDSSQLKSYDLATFDESGNVIPPSKRANPESPSILYSKAEEDMDAEYLALAKDPVANRAELQRMVDAAAKNARSTERLSEDEMNRQASSGNVLGVKIQTGTGQGSAARIAVDFNDRVSEVFSEFDDHLTWWAYLKPGWYLDDESLATAHEDTISKLRASLKRARPLPVTYDDAGDPIPLSKRFDETKPSILFSKADEDDIPADDFVPKYDQPVDVPRRLVDPSKVRKTKAKQWTIPPTYDEGTESWSPARNEPTTAPLPPNFGTKARREALDKFYSDAPDHLKYFTQQVGTQTGFVRLTQAIEPMIMFARAKLGGLWGNYMPEVTVENTENAKEIAKKLLTRRTYGKELVKEWRQFHSESDAKDRPLHHGDAVGAVLQMELFDYAVRLASETGDLSLAKMIAPFANDTIIGDYLTMSSAARALGVRSYAVQNQNGFWQALQHHAAGKLKAAEDVAGSAQVLKELQEATYNKEILDEAVADVQSDAETTAEGKEIVQEVANAKEEAIEAAEDAKDFPAAFDALDNDEKSLLNQLQETIKTLESKIRQLKDMGGSLESKGETLYSKATGASAGDENLLRQEIADLKKTLNEVQTKLDKFESSGLSQTARKKATAGTKKAVGAGEQARKLLESYIAKPKRTPRDKPAWRKDYEKAIKDKTIDEDDFVADMKRHGIGEETANRLWSAVEERREGRATAKKARNKLKGKEDESDEDRATDTAKDIIDTLDKAQTEWVKPDAKKNEIRELAKQVVANLGPLHDKFREYTPLFEELGVKPEVAEVLIRRLWDLKQARLSAKETRQRAGAAKGIRFINSLVRSILDAPQELQTSPEWRNKTMVTAFQDAGMTEQRAQDAAKWLERSLEKSLANARIKAVERTAGRLKNKKITLEALREAIRAGVFDSTNPVATALAKVAGFSELTPAQTRRLAELDSLIATSGPTEAGEYKSEMFSILNKAQSPKTAGQITTQSWINTALSSLGTQMLNWVQSISGPATKVGVEMARLVGEVATGNITSTNALKKFGYIIKIWVNSHRRWLDDARFSGRTDSYRVKMLEEFDEAHRLVREYEDAVREWSLWRKQNPAKTAKAAIKIMFTATDIVRRSMSMADNAWGSVLQNQILQLEAMRSMMEKGGLSASQAWARLQAAQTRAKEAMDQRKAEKPDDLVRARLVGRDVFEAELVKETELASGVKGEGQSVLTTATKESTALLGNRRAEDSPWWDVFNNFFELAKGMSRLGEKHFGGLIAKMIFGFISVNANILNYTANYTPMGYFRYRHRKNNPDTEKYRETMATEAQMRTRLAESIIGSTFMLVMAMLRLLDDDDDDFVTITGAGPEGKPERDSWMAQGHKPNHFEVMNSKDEVLFSIPTTRGGLQHMAIPMMMLGAIDDTLLRKGPAERRGENAFTIGEYANSLGPTFSSVAGFFGVKNLLGTRTPVALTEKGVVGNVAYAAAPLVPFSGLLKSLTKLYSGPLDTRSGVEAAIWANVPVVNTFKIPGIPVEPNARSLNTFGDEIGVHTNSAVQKALDRAEFASILPIFINAANSGPRADIYRFISETGLAPAVPNRTALAKNNTVTSKMWTDYVKTRGQLLVDAIRNNEAKLRRMEQADAESEMEKISADSTKAAKKTLGLK